MKTLQLTLESLLDTDFDITDQDINTLEEFLRKYKYGKKLKKSAPYDEFIKACTGCQKVLHLQDAGTALKQGKAILTIAARANGTDFCLWKYGNGWVYEYDSMNLGADWSRLRKLSPRGLDIHDIGLIGQSDPRSLWRKAKKLVHFILEPWQYQKFFEILSK